MAETAGAELTAAPVPKTGARQVLLVGWDGADWNLLSPLLDAGLLPSLARLIEGGTVADLSTPEPLVCATLWTSAVTGQRGHDHGILGDFEPEGEGPIAHRARSTSRRTAALWNLYSDSGRRSLAIGWPASHPAEAVRGACLSDRYHRRLESKPPSGSIYPCALERNLSELRLRGDEITEAHLAPFVPGLRSLSNRGEGELEILANVLAETATVQAAATWLMEKESWDFCAVRYEGIERLSSAFLRFHQSPEPSAYQDVVAGAYRFHDMMLARLLELAASDSLVMVVSDHGVISHEMPRPGGLLVAAGPRVRADERIYGASLLDVAPTILAFSGLPIPADIEGRTLLEIFDGTIEVERRGAVSRSSRDAVEPFEDIEVELPEAAKLLRYNHARSLLGAERAEDAACVLEELRRDYSDDEHLVLLHAQALYAQGQFDACRALLQRFEPSQRPPMAEVLLGFLAFRDGRPEETLERLARAEASGSRLPRLHHEIGSAYLQLRRWDDAARSFRCALAIDGGSARTRDGLASALLALGRPEEALEEALRAVRLSHGLASAHFHLGVALAGTGERERAIQALETSVALDGNASDARLLLHRLREDEAAQVRARNA